MNYTRAVSVSRFILVILCIALVLSIALCGIDSWGLGGIFEPGTIRLGLDPVSYTHLDVYKRQIGMRNNKDRQFGMSGANGFIKRIMRLFKRFKRSGIIIVIHHKRAHLPRCLLYTSQRPLRGCWTYT